jgi:uncharacterized protein
MSPGLLVGVCARCGRMVFPARILCPGCSGSEWRREWVDTGVVEEVTIVHDEAVRIGSVRLEGGPAIVVQLGPEAEPGSRVRLAVEGGRPGAI